MARYALTYLFSDYSDEGYCIIMATKTARVLSSVCVTVPSVTIYREAECRGGIMGDGQQHEWEQCNRQQLVFLLALLWSPEAFLTAVMRAVCVYSHLCC